MNVHEGLRERLVERFASTLVPGRSLLTARKLASGTVVSLALTELLEAADAMADAHTCIGMPPCARCNLARRYRTARSRTLGEGERG